MRKYCGHKGGWVEWSWQRWSWSTDTAAAPVAASAMAPGVPAPPATAPSLLQLIRRGEFELALEVAMREGL